MVAHALTLRRPVGRAIKRTISLDVLLPMASALQVGLDELLNVRLEPAPTAVQQQVHPGHDWFFVISGRVRLLLGDREITVQAGEAAEFGTMTPHSVAAVEGPAELIMIFDRDGQRAHVHRDADSSGRS